MWEQTAQSRWPTLFVFHDEMNNSLSIRLQMEFGVRFVAQEDPIIPLLSSKMTVMWLSLKTEGELSASG